MKKSESILTSDVSEYLLRIKNNISIIYPPDEVNNIMEFLISGVKEYITEHPEYTMAEIEEYLKTTDIFADWIQNTQSSEIADKIDFHSVQRKGGLFVFTVAFLIISLFVASFFVGGRIAEKNNANLKTIQIKN